MSVIRWEPPDRPGAYRLRHDWGGIAAALRRKPGKWALVATENSIAAAGGVAGSIRRGGYLAMRPAGSFDACARTVDEEFRVYARYVGGES